MKMMSSLQLIVYFDPRDSAASGAFLPGGENGWPHRLAQAVNRIYYDLLGESDSVNASQASHPILGLRVMEEKERISQESFSGKSHCIFIQP